MAKGMAGTTWRLLLVLLIMTSGAILAWVKVKRRRCGGSMPLSWSELDPTAPASLGLPATAMRVTADSAAEVPAPQVPEVEAPEVRLTIIDAPAVADGPAAGPYPGSALPLDDGSAPSDDFVVKGNAGSMRSHSTSSPYFGRTRAEVWFRTQDDAAAAGFEPWAPKK